ncbi:unnamed protein product [Caenorhabditis auriculariae]|uniref:Uncharacterized protein n=1 Tax=Caenorhabditis auriculariae TaxID=2777116 RepID=A0A8S1H387_9PELO|nr:unnamed protein product [Caenorhabditis auriculariae]
MRRRSPSSHLYPFTVKVGTCAHGGDSTPSGAAVAAVKCLPRNFKVECVENGWCSRKSAAGARLVEIYLPEKPEHGAAGEMRQTDVLAGTRAHAKVET